jgi:hypothetical protein
MFDNYTCEIEEMTRHGTSHCPYASEHGTNRSSMFDNYVCRIEKKIKMPLPVY